MQRWIVAIGVIVVLLLGGGAFAYRAYQQNRETKIWLPLPINEELATVQREALVKTLEDQLGELALLTTVCKDVGLAAKLGLSSDEAAAKNVKGRLFVVFGQADTPMGKVPSINVGVTCKVKEFETMRLVTERLKPEVFKIIGIREPKSTEF